MVVHDILLNIFTNGGLSDAGRHNWHQHCFPVLLIVTHFLRVGRNENIHHRLVQLKADLISVLVSPAKLPRFWIFMYRATPINYFVSAMISTGVSGVSLVCFPNEIMMLEPPFGQNCSSYLMEYIRLAGGNLLNPGAEDHCQFCPISRADTVLNNLGIHFQARWRNFGITLAYNTINVAGTLILYWLFRVPKGQRRRNA